MLISFDFALRVTTALAIAACVTIAYAQNAPHAIGPPPGNLEAAAGEPTLAPVLRWAEQGAAAIEQVEDYTARLIKRERIRGRLESAKQLFIKIRHKPLSVYARFETTGGRVTQEIVYVQGKNRNRMWVHSERRKLIGTVSINPSSRLALREGRYPITGIGLLALTNELVKHTRQAIAVPDTRTQVYRDATIDGRPTLALAVTHDQPHEDLSYHHARVFIDREWNVPVRYESWGFPSEPGGPPRLLEQYTYLDLAFNVGLTDADFDIRNDEYSFPIPKSFEDELTEEQLVEAAEPPPSAAPTAAPAPRPAPVKPATVAADYARHVDAARKRLRQSPTYTCLVVHRAAKDGQLASGEFFRLKHRQEPLGIYMRGFWPAEIQQQRLLYAPDKHRGYALFRRSADLPGKWLSPTQLQRFSKGTQSLTELGIDAMLSSASVRIDDEGRANHVTVRRYSKARIDSVACVCFEITRAGSAQAAGSKQTRGTYRQRVFFDTNRKLPIRFEMYDRPASGRQHTPLVEAVTYRNIVLGARVQPNDFDPLNPSYGFSTPPVVATFNSSP